MHSFASMVEDSNPFQDLDEKKHDFDTDVYIRFNISSSTLLFIWKENTPRKWKIIICTNVTITVKYLG